MSELRLNQKKDYGLVAGMPGVAYQQDDQLFDIEGYHVGPVYANNVAPTKKRGRMTKEERETLEAALEAEKQAESEDTDYMKEFLAAMLDGGPISKSSVYTASEERGFGWEQLLKVADEMQIVKFKRKTVEYWDLNRELPSTAG